MNRKTSRAIIITAAAIVVVAAVLIVFVAFQNDKLVLKDAKSGEKFASFPIEDGERFSVEFVHSVNKSPVRDVYEIRDGGEIYVVETKYYAFGAGVQTELNDGEKILYGDDGSMTITNINTHIPQLTYVVGTISDHVFRISGEEISLRELCGKNTFVSFTIDRNWLP